MVIFRPNLAYTHQFSRKIAEKVPKTLKNRQFCVIFSPFSSNFRGGGSPSARGGGGSVEKLRRGSMPMYDSQVVDFIFDLGNVIRN